MKHFITVALLFILPFTGFTQVLWYTLQNAGTDNGLLHLYESLENDPAGVVSDAYLSETDPGYAYLRINAAEWVSQEKVLYFGFTGDNSQADTENFQYAFYLDQDQLQILEEGDVIETINTGSLSWVDLQIERNGTEVVWRVNGTEYVSTAEWYGEHYLQVISAGAESYLDPELKAGQILQPVPLEWGFLQNANGFPDYLLADEATQPFPAGGITVDYIEDNGGSIRFLASELNFFQQAVQFGFTATDETFEAGNFSYSFYVKDDELAIIEGGELMATVSIEDLFSLEIEKRGGEIIYYMDGLDIYTSETEPLTKQYLQVITSGPGGNLPLSMKAGAGEEGSGGDEGGGEDPDPGPGGEDPGNGPPAPETPPAYTAASPEMRNYIYETTYSGGVPVAANKVYFDKLGREVQALSQNLESAHVIVNENKYDEFGRLKVSSLPFSTFANEMDYFVPNGFVHRTDVAYTHLDNEGKFSVTYPVQTGSKGSLGWYYSESNYEDKNIASSVFPYVQYEYFEGSGEVRKASRPGTDFKIGSEKESRNYRSYIATLSELPEAMIPDKTSKFLATKSIDSDGNAVTVYQSKDMIITKAGSGTLCAPGVKWKFEYYDKRGRLVKMVSPEAFNCGFSAYNNLTEATGTVSEASLEANTVNLAFTQTLAVYPDDVRDRRFVISEVVPDLELPDNAQPYTPPTGTQPGNTYCVPSPCPTEPDDCDNNIVGVSTINGNTYAISSFCPDVFTNGPIPPPPPVYPNLALEGPAVNSPYPFEYEYGVWGYRYTVKVTGQKKSDGTTVNLLNETVRFVIKSDITLGHTLHYVTGSTSGSFGEGIPPRNMLEMISAAADAALNVDLYSNLKIYIENFQEAGNYSTDIPFDSHTFAPVLATSYPMHFFDGIDAKVALREYSDPAKAIAEENTYTYAYNDKDEVTRSRTPDAGTVRYLYNDKGYVRFTQNEQQALSGKFYYMHYDHLGRVTESGEYIPPVSGAKVVFGNAGETPPGLNPGDLLAGDIVNGADGLDDSRCFEENYFSYDKAATDFPAALNASLYPSKFNGGQLVRSANGVNTTWYGYDVEGRLSWMVQQISALGIKTVSYQYNSNGMVGEMIYQREVAAERLHHHFTYDNNLQLKKVSTSTNGSANFAERATYQYYDHGPLKRVVLGRNVQGMDYLYTIQGWLKFINDPTLAENDPGKDGVFGGNMSTAADLFGMALTYFPGDYTRGDRSFYQESGVTGNYNGLVSSQAWQTDNSNLQVMADDILSYTYTYDNNGQMTAAVLGTAAPGTGSAYAITALNDYKVNIGYDHNGNISSLLRNGHSSAGLNMDNLSYNYTLRSDGMKYHNRLRSVNDVVASSPYSGDMENQAQSDNYLYNLIGQLTEDKAAGVQYTYNSSGQVSSVVKTSTSHLLYTYHYNEKGQKVFQTFYDPFGEAFKRMYYTYDASGNVMGIYRQDLTGENPAVIAEKPVYGSGRIGTWNVEAGEMVYELKDHLGNVRMALGAVRNNGLWRVSEDYEDPQDDSFSLNADIGYASRSYVNGRFQVDVQNNAQNTEGIYQQLPLTPNRTFRLTLEYGEIVDLYGQMVLIMADKTTGQVLASINPQAGENTLTFTTGSNGTTYLRIYLDGWNPPNSAYWLDNILLEELPQVWSVTDYYPFGSPMPGRNYVSGQGNYRHGYQGEFAEEDATGLHSFMLRQFDSRLGRWLSPDPMMQYASAYLGMGNNPVSMVDPTGGVSYHNRECDCEWDTEWGGYSPYVEGGVTWGGSGNLSAAYSNWGSFYESSAFFNSTGIFDQSYLNQLNSIANYHNLSGLSANASFNNTRKEYGVWTRSVEFGRGDSKTNTVGEVFITETWTSQGRSSRHSSMKNWDNTSLALDVGGGLYGALEGAALSKNNWLGKNGKYYSMRWSGNRYTGSRSGALKVASQYKWAGRATLGASVAVGALQVYDGYQMDGEQFGYNAQLATAETIGSIGGGIAGAALGAKIGAGIGVWFGGVGAIPGAVIGGFIGGIVGGSVGADAGGTTVNWYYREK